MDAQFEPQPEPAKDGVIGLIKAAMSLELHMQSAAENGYEGVGWIPVKPVVVILFNRVDFVAAAHYLVAEGCEVDMVLNGGLCVEASWVHITRSEHEYDLSLTVRLS
jgi:hypothetical protein